LVDHDSTSIVVPCDVDLRLDRFVTDHLAGSDDERLQGLSRSRIQKLIEEGSLLVDGQKVRRSFKLRGGEWLTLTIPQPVPIDVAPEAMDLLVLHEDSDLIVLNKSPGIVVHPGAGITSGTLVNALLAHCSDLSGIGGALRPGIVHRLDRDTSGVIIMAKNDRAHEGLARQFADRKVVKLYDAFVLGVPKPAKDSIETLFGRHPKDRKRFSSRVKEGRHAITRYETVASAAGVSRLRIDLGTGRTHQIRVHLSDRGHPIIADKLYGGLKLRGVEPGAVYTAAKALQRQALHAAHLEFTHPVSGAELSFDAPLPDDLGDLARAMGEQIP